MNLDMGRLDTTATTYAVVAPNAPEAGFDYARFMDVILRRRLLIISVACLFATIAHAYLAFAPRTYTAATRVMLDAKEIRAYQDGVFLPVPVTYSGIVETHVELVKSDSVANQVIADLRLRDDPEFSRSPERWDCKRLASLLPFSAPLCGEVMTRLGIPVEKPQADEDDLRIRSKFKTGLSANQIGLSYIIEVAFTSGEPQKSARIVNGVVQAFMALVAAENARTAEAASASLRDRARQLGVSITVIAQAIPPTSANGPRKIMLLFGALLLGAATGVGFAFVRDMRDDRIRTLTDAAAAAGVECVGLLPQLPRTAGRDASSVALASRDGVERGIRNTSPTLDVAVRLPRSRFSQTMQRLRLAALDRYGVRPVSIGITSTLPGEGKTTVAVNLARITALCGTRTLLIDCNFYQPHLSHLLAPDAVSAANSDPRTDKRSLVDRVWRDDVSPMHFLPASGVGGIRRPDLIWCDRMSELLQDACNVYDAVIFDLPPLAPVPDVRGVADKLDAFFLVTEWGRVPRAELEDAIRADRRFQNKLLGIVLNKVNMKAFKRWSSRHRHFARTYHDYVEG